MTVDRVRAGLYLVAAGGSVVLAGACMGWVRSGARMRNSFASVRSARTLGVLDGRSATIAAAWYLLPLAVGFCWLACGTGRRAASGLLAVLVGLGGVAAVVAATRAPVGLGNGPVVTALGSALALVGAVALAFDGRRRSHESAR